MPSDVVVGSSVGTCNLLMFSSTRDPIMEVTLGGEMERVRFQVYWTITYASPGLNINIL